MKIRKWKNIMLIPVFIVSSLILMGCPSPSDGTATDGTTTDGTTTDGTTTDGTAKSWTTLDETFSDSADDFDMKFDGQGNLYLAFKNEADSTNVTVQKYDGTSWNSLGTATTTSSPSSDLFVGTGWSSVSIGYTNTNSKAVFKEYSGIAWDSEISSPKETLAYSLGYATSVSGNPYLMFIDKKAYVSSDVSSGDLPSLVTKGDDDPTAYVGDLYCGDNYSSNAQYKRIVDLEVGSKIYGLLGRDILSSTENPASIDLVQYDGTSWIIKNTLISTSDYDADNSDITDAIDSTIYGRGSSTESLYVALYNKSTNKIDIKKYDGIELETTKAGITPDSNNTVKSLHLISQELNGSVKMLYLVVTMSGDYTTTTYVYSSSDGAEWTLIGDKIATETYDTAIACKSDDGVNTILYVATRKSNVISIHQYK